VDIRAVERAISRELPVLSFVGVEIKGVRATIQVVEKILPDIDQDVKRPANLIAKKEGVITEILVLQGASAVAEGDTVSRGQVLISGLIMPEQPEEEGDNGQEAPPEAVPLRVRARGIVRARVWYKAEGAAPRVEMSEVPSGKRAKRFTVMAGGRQITLSGPRKSPYRLGQEETIRYQFPAWRSFRLPVEILVTNYSQLKREVKLRSVEETASLAQEEAWEKIKSQLPAGAKVVDKRITTVTGEDSSSVRVEMIVETVEDIGEVQALE
jgi:similar to stage IV sporulation protein